MCLLSAAIIDFADLFVTVQLRGSDSGPEGHDRQTAGARDWVQNHGARPRLHEGQEEGKLFHIFGDLSPEKNQRLICMLRSITQVSPLHSNLIITF